MSCTLAFHRGCRAILRGSLLLLLIVVPRLAATAADPSWWTAPVEELAAGAETYGSPERGALVFFQSAAACATCHDESAAAAPLGPKLSGLGPETMRTHIVESILYPSRQIAEEYQARRILTVEGQVITGLVGEQQEDFVLLRSAENLLEEIKLPRARIEAMAAAETSLMPEGLAQSLNNREAFFDLVEYVVAVAHGGAERARQLRPDPARLQLADDTEDLDHAGILRSLSEADLEAGRNIFAGHCVNCHGADGNQPKLAAARAFGTQQLKFGADPLSMLRTLTFGNGLMGPMRHLSPRERYQVIYYIRRDLMRGRNPGYQEIDEAYLAELPQGEWDGVWEFADQRDFGPVLASQLGQQVQSGLTFRLPHEITVNYDLHRFRLGGAWQGGFLDLSETQHFRQRGERMPQPVGTPLGGLEGYGWELDGEFEIAADQKPPRGPVNPRLAEYHGHYLFGRRAILSYRIADRQILETLGAARLEEAPLIRHLLSIGPGDEPLRLRVLEQTREGEVEWLPLPAEIAQADAGGRIPLVPTAPEDAIDSPQNANLAWETVTGEQARELDLGTPGRSLVVRFRTDGTGTLVASAPPEGRWQPNGKTLFIRGGRLVYDIGWVGDMESRSRVDDNRWHMAALVVDEDETRLFVDGELEARRAAFRRPPEEDHVLKVGATAENFAGDYSGEIAWATILDRALNDESVRDLANRSELNADVPAERLWRWQPSEDDPAPTAEPVDTAATLAGGWVRGDVTDLRWVPSENGGLALEIPPGKATRLIELTRFSLQPRHRDRVLRYAGLRSQEQIEDPREMRAGGPERWPERLRSLGRLGEAKNGYALDTVEIPLENPWNAWLRTSALDFFPDGRCVVTTHGGDVYLVDGLDNDLREVTWKRFAAGLFEPFGVRVLEGKIYVTCRDGLKRLHDYDGNDEVDFVEAFWNDDDVSNMFHAYNFDLQTDAEGNFYFAKAGQYTRHHRPGTIMKIPPRGGTAEVVAFGLRTPNGMGILPDGRVTVSDNQGPWMPAGKISLATPGAFLGNMPINDAQDAWLRAKSDGELPDSFDEPFIWMPQELDNSCGGQLWVEDPRFGPLSGRLMHSSFGKGWLYHLSLQEIDGVTQSSIIALPHQWDAGVMRLRVNPADGQVYGTGLSGWQGPPAGKDGCLQRLRYTGQSVRMVDRVRVVPEGIELRLNFALGEGAREPDSWQAEMWNYRWSRQYGSDQYSVREPGREGRDQLRIEGVKLGEDRRVAILEIDDLATCDQLLLRVELEDAEGRPFERDVYLTVHRLAEDVTIR
jgi:putative heme-binding domain-containing protein